MSSSLTIPIFFCPFFLLSFTFIHFSFLIFFLPNSHLSSIRVQTPMLPLSTSCIPFQPIFSFTIPFSFSSSIRVQTPMLPLSNSCFICLFISILISSFPHNFPVFFILHRKFIPFSPLSYFYLFVFHCSKSALPLIILLLLSSLPFLCLCCSVSSPHTVTLFSPPHLSYLLLFVFLRSQSTNCLIIFSFSLLLVLFIFFFIPSC